LEVEEAKGWEGYLSDYIKPGEVPNEPFSAILYTVVNELDRIQPLEANSSSENMTIAVISSLFFWRDVFKGILPQGGKGIIVVMENQCSPSFTYQVE
jgi:hypothetical protein